MDICTTPPPPPPDDKEPPLPAAPPPPLPPARVATPPPPAWGPEPEPKPEPKKEIGDELLSFYNDIASLDAPPAPAPPAPAPPPRAPSAEPPPPGEGVVERYERVEAKAARKKSKVKISSSMGMKHKSVSSLVAKWQQVADEIHSD